MKRYLLRSKLISEKRGLVIFLLLLSMILCSYRVWVLSIYSFRVPASDFFAFRSLAIDLLDGTVYWGNKRLPLFPLMMAILGKVLELFSIHRPYLLAGYIINIVSLGLSIPFLFLINKKMLNNNLLTTLSVFLFMINPIYLFWATQPLLETVFVFAILFTYYLHLYKRFELKYFGVLFSSLIRYEAVLLSLIFVLDDYIYRKKVKTSILLGSIASSGVIFWSFMAYLSYGGIGYILQIEQVGTHSGLNFLRSLLKALILGLVLETNRISYLAVGLFLIPIMLFGVFKSTNRHFFGISSWIFGYTLLHMYFSFAFIRFSLPILWGLIIFFIYGLKKIFSTAAEKFHLFHQLTSKIILVSATFLCIIFTYFFGYLNRNLRFFWIDLSSVFLLLFTFASCIYILEKKTLSKCSIWTFFCVLFIITSGAIYNGDVLTETAAYEKIEFRGVGEWFRDNAQEGDILVATEVFIVQYYSELSDNYFLSTEDFKANSTDEFISELKEIGVSYVVWDSYQGNRARDYYFYSYKVYLISFLQDGTDKPHFKLVHSINVNSHIAYVYHFIP